MKVDASIRSDSLRIRKPPNHRTITIIMVPRNSDMGWAAFWRMTISFMPLRNSLFTKMKRFSILCSAMNALIIRRPPRVSSSWAMMSPHCPCTADDWLFSFRLTAPIIQPASGATTMTNTVSCQLTVNRVKKHTMIAIGWRMSMSMELVIEFSTTCTSALIRAMISPFRSSEKKLSGNFSTFSYTSIRMSLTTPVRNGTITAEETKYPNVFSPVITIRATPM